MSGNVNCTELARTATEHAILRANQPGRRVRRYYSGGFAEYIEPLETSPNDWMRLPGYRYQMTHFNPYLDFGPNPMPEIDISYDADKIHIVDPNYVHVMRMPDLPAPRNQ